MPASAGAGKAMIGAAAKTAVAMDLVTNFILVIPTSLRTGAITGDIAPEWLIFGQPRAETARFQ
jgi:hypothetical protein